MHKRIERKKRRGKKKQLAVQKKRKSKQKPYIYFSGSYYSRLSSAVAGHSSERALMIRFASWSQLLVVSLRRLSLCSPPPPPIVRLMFHVSCSKGTVTTLLAPVASGGTGTERMKEREKKGERGQRPRLLLLSETLFWQDREWDTESNKTGFSLTTKVFHRDRNRQELTLFWTKEMIEKV